jgi:hypothetical protein
MQGGIAKVQALLQEVSRVAKYNADTLEEVRPADCYFGSHFRLTYDDPL